MEMVRDLEIAGYNCDVYTKEDVVMAIDHASSMHKTIIKMEESMKGYLDTASLPSTHTFVRLKPTVYELQYSDFRRMFANYFSNYEYARKYYTLAYEYYEKIEKEGYVRAVPYIYATKRGNAHEVEEGLRGLINVVSSDLDPAPQVGLKSVPLSSIDTTQKTAFSKAIENLCNERCEKCCESSIKVDYRDDEETLESMLAEMRASKKSNEEPRLGIEKATYESKPAPMLTDAQTKRLMELRGESATPDNTDSKPSPKFKSALTVMSNDVEHPDASKTSVTSNEIVVTKQKSTSKPSLIDAFAQGVNEGYNSSTGESLKVGIPIVDPTTQNLMTSRKTVVKGKKSMALAIILSIFLPGLGYLYAGKITGLVLFIVTLILCWTIIVPIIIIIVGLCLTCTLVDENNRIWAEANA